MKIVSVLARKGGTGKSTCCRCLAIEALKAGRRTVILDGDPQGTSIRWSERRKGEGINVPQVAVPAGTSVGLASQIERFRGQGVSLLLIDTPPVATPIINAALGQSTGAVIVVRPNPEDLESVAETLRLTTAVNQLSATVLWQTPPDKRVKTVALARDYLAKAKIEVAPFTASASVLYPYAYARGLTVQELEPGSRARAEIADIWGWLQKSEIV